MFASYHVYPYYPEFMNYEPTYQNWVDPKTNARNPYKAYLNDLIDTHHMPVLIAEFGLPSSRGITHLNPDGYHQGGHTETEQGHLLVDLIHAIHESNAIGALIFSWQDEWFKRTWNTMDFDLSWRRPFWSNIETNEQFFGILAMEPNTEDTIHHVDQSLTDWHDVTPLHETSTQKIWMDSDYRYLYFTIQDKQFDFENNQLFIPIDTINNQGNSFSSNYDITFDIDADFLMIIDGISHAKIVVDQYYDANHYLYTNVLDMIPPSTNTIMKNSGLFHPIKHVLSAELTLPQTNETIPFSDYETGNLQYGNSNPSSQNYHSLADYYFGSDFVEIRIPWLLLNVMDPSTKQIIADFNQTNDTYFSPETATGFTLQTIYLQNELWQHSLLVTYDWEAWHSVIYHERLKDSYYIIQDAFETLH